MDLVITIMEWRIQNFGEGIERIFKKYFKSPNTHSDVFYVHIISQQYPTMMITMGIKPNIYLCSILEKAHLSPSICDADFSTFE